MPSTLFKCVCVCLCELVLGLLLLGALVLVLVLVLHFIAIVEDAQPVKINNQINVNKSTANSSSSHFWLPPPARRTLSLCWVCLPKFLLSNCGGSTKKTKNAGTCWPCCEHVQRRRTTPKRAANSLYSTRRGKWRYSFYGIQVHQLCTCVCVCVWKPNACLQMHFDAMRPYPKWWKNSAQNGEKHKAGIQFEMRRFCSLMFIWGICVKI